MKAFAELWRTAPADMRADVVDLFLATPTIAAVFFVFWAATS
ncbi:hypothetical protein [Novosphingobium clariflavum]|uniref:Uncharacterized protein n=1 Tax=Novosphingobium clariflavum TaxID=2029884 RepID=A0ABV6S7D5_9SPHN|nr:hypothetical protein [Novosphingobium clariflavum]